MLLEIRVPRIFISYRREDAAGEAGRLHDNLVSSFGSSQVFMDVVNLQPGDDFVEEIKDAVGACDVLVAVIGRRWLSTEHTSGGRRLDEPEDSVRLEIEASLERNVRVVPALVAGAAMLRSSELPESIAALAGRQAVELSHLRWAHDVGRLVEAIKRAGEAGPARPQSSPPPPGEPPPVGPEPKCWSSSLSQGKIPPSRSTATRTEVRKPIRSFDQ